jgi:hypothetical protein
MSYEIFNRKVQYRGTMAIALTKMGQLSFNKGASNFLQERSVGNVILLWDKEKRKIGIRPITEKDPRSYNIHWNKRGDGAGFSVATFLKYIEYDASETRTFPARWDEQQLMFEIEVQKEHFKPGGYITPMIRTKKPE